MLTALALLLITPAQARPAEKPDISCELRGNYMGNAISPVFRLKIGPPDKPQWTYSTSDDMFGTLKPPRVATYRGTYEIDGDLVIFTGQQVEEKDREIRFALNYGFPGGKVAFDRLFPTGDNEFTHHRKWFRQKDGKWQPAEEWKLTMTLPEKLGETIEVKWRGEIVQWSMDGKREAKPIDTRVRYKRSQTDWYVRENLTEETSVHSELILERDKEKIVSITWSNRYIGDLRGFHPGAANLPGGRK